jgi:hypothetical protein
VVDVGEELGFADLYEPGVDECSLSPARVFYQQVDVDEWAESRVSVKEGNLVTLDQDEWPLARCSHALEHDRRAEDAESCCALLLDQPGIGLLASLAQASCGEGTEAMPEEVFHPGRAVDERVD